MVGLRGHGLDTRDDPHLLRLFQLGSAILMVAACHSELRLCFVIEALEHRSVHNRSTATAQSAVKSPQISQGSLHLSSAVSSHAVRGEAGSVSHRSHDASARRRPPIGPA